jgi:hypothetical protein
MGNGLEIWNMEYSTWGGVDWIDLAQDRGNLRAFMNAVMKLRFHSVLGISLLTENVLASQGL